MNDYFTKSKERLNRWCEKYPNSPCRVASNIIWWNFKFLMKTFFNAERENKRRCITGNQKHLLSEVNSWLNVLDSSGKDISLKYALSINQYMVPKITPDQREEIYFHLENLLLPNSQFKRVGFVFFMGIGDYFYATNFLEMFHRKYPHIKLDAYVSKNTDNNNSPLVGKCLEKNPLFENIYYFDGKPCPSEWKNYDYSECYKLKSADTLLLPMIYLYNSEIGSRTEGLCKVFNFPEPSINPKPIIYDYTPSDQVIDAFENIKLRAKKVIFFQMSGRSSYYIYPYTDELIKKALHAGYFVITPEKTEIVDDNLYVIDIRNFFITDTISLLKLIRDRHIPLYFCAVSSCSLPIASALERPCLCLQQLFCNILFVRGIYYSNMFFVEPCIATSLAIPADRSFVAPKGTYTADSDKIVYSPDFVWDCFLKMTELWDKNLPMQK